MKLQRFNKYVAAIMISVMALTGSSCALDLEREEVVIEETYNEEPNIVIIHNFKIPSADEVYEDIAELGSISDEKKISNTYKVLEFSDEDNIYKVMIVGARVDYITDYEGKVIATQYTVYDAFSNEDLFITSNMKYLTDIQVINSLFDGASVISCKPLERLGEIAKDFGANDEYVNSVMNKNQTITDKDAAIMYVSLIPDYNRTTLEQLQNKELGR